MVAFFSRPASRRSNTARIWSGLSVATSALSDRPCYAEYACNYGRGHLLPMTDWSVAMVSQKHLLALGYAMNKDLASEARREESFGRCQ